MSNSKQLKVVKKDVVDIVENKIQEFKSERSLHFPENYSPENAMKSAWLQLQDIKDKNGNPVIESCSKNSIANALLDMVVQGLSPAKKQCYFVAYGSDLTLMRSYFGTMAVTKRLEDVEDVSANVIYQGDELDYEVDPVTGKKNLLKHKPNFENIDNNKISGAYAIIVTKGDLPNHLEVMSMSQIRDAWRQGATNGNSPAHKNFPGEMAKKTVINRACKYYANTSDDSDLLIEAFNNTTENEYTKNDEENVQKEIEEKANKKELKFKDDVEDVDDYKEMKAEENVEGGKQTSMMDDDAKRGPDF